MLLVSESLKVVIVKGQKSHHEHDHNQKYWKYERILNSRNGIHLMWSLLPPMGSACLVHGESCNRNPSVRRHAQEQEAYPRAHPNRSGIPGSMIKGWKAKCTEKVTIVTPQPESRQQS